MLVKNSQRNRNRRRRSALKRNERNLAFWEQTKLASKNSSVEFYKMVVDKIQKVRLTISNTLVNLNEAE